MLLSFCLLGLQLGADAVSFRSDLVDVDEKLKNAVRHISESELWRPPTYEPGLPFFVHVPHGKKEDVEKAASSIRQADFDTSRTRMPANVAFVFPSNHEESLLQESFEGMSVPFHMVGKTESSWSDYAKVGPLLELIRSQAIPEKYLVFCDADDVVPVTKDFSGIIDAFNFYNATLVMAASQHDEPSMPVVSLFEDQVSPWAKKDAFRGDSGCFMARTKDLGVLLTMIPYPDDSKAFSFAKTLRIAHMNRYPAFKVDSLNMLFKTMPSRPGATAII